MSRAARRSARRRLATPIGAFYLVMAGINIGIAVADSSTYSSFAEHGLFAFVRSGWREIVMTHPQAWIGLLAAGEMAIGLAFLGRARWQAAAYGASISFHLALMLFGWGVWLWAVPALVFLVFAARHDLRSTDTGAVASTPT